MHLLRRKYDFCAILAFFFGILSGSAQLLQEIARANRHHVVRTGVEGGVGSTQWRWTRKAISSAAAAYPMNPIGVVQSCFSTRNGTPRQPLLVPLARACLALDPTRVPAEGLEGLANYSHCWILYVFHLNIDLDKLWKEPSRSKFKAKVRVPRLGGGKVGVLSTRSPHRPCPIGLTVAKNELS